MRVKIKWLKITVKCKDKPIETLEEFKKLFNKKELK